MFLLWCLRDRFGFTSHNDGLKAGLRQLERLGRLGLKNLIDEKMGDALRRQLSWVCVLVWDEVERQ